MSGRDFRQWAWFIAGLIAAIVCFVIGVSLPDGLPAAVAVAPLAGISGYAIVQLFVSSKGNGA
jgi:uncharacterized membrane protein